MMRLSALNYYPENGIITPVTRSETGRFLLSSADDSIAYCYWVKHPVLMDSRPADRVTTSAISAGCFVMTLGDGLPCIRCGKSEWYASGHCKGCKQECNQRWKEANPERRKEGDRRYYENNRERRNEIQRQYREKNRERVIESSRRWRKANPKPKKEGGRQHHGRNLELKRKSDRRYVEVHSERIKERVRQWCRANPDQARAIRHRYRARKTGAGGSYTAAEWIALCNQYDNRCLRCGRDDVKLTADHVIPIAQGGNSNIDNIQPLCKSCNSSKSDKHIDYRTKPGLLRWIQGRLFE